MLTGHRKVGAWLAWSLCLLCVSLVATNLTFGLLNGRGLIEFLREGDAAVMVLVLSFSVVGALIVSIRPENTTGWIFCAAALFQAFSESGLEYPTYVLITRLFPPGSRDILVCGVDLGPVAWPDPDLPTLLFPNGRPPLRSWWRGSASSPSA
jgi:MFS family permease